MTSSLEQLNEVAREKGAFPLESKHLFYREVNFVYILNNLPAANDTDNVNEVSLVKANFWQMVGQNYRL